MITTKDLFHQIKGYYNIGYKNIKLENFTIKIHDITEEFIPYAVEIRKLSEEQFNIEIKHFANLINLEVFPDYLKIIYDFNENNKGFHLHLQNQVLVAKFEIKYKGIVEFHEELSYKTEELINPLYKKLMQEQWKTKNM